MTEKNQTAPKKMRAPHLVEILGGKDHPSKTKRLPLGEMAKIFAASIGPACKLLTDPCTFHQLPRLWREGIDPVLHFIIESSNTAVINQWLNAGAKVGFLCSFPRSGNTWMRFMLADILFQMHGVETTTALPADPDDLIAVSSRSSIVRRIGRCPRWAYEAQVAFVKSHGSFPRLEQFFSSPRGEQRRRDAKAFYLFRAPEDALVSLYHLKVRDDYTRSRAQHDIDGFCLKELAGWIDMTSSYLQAAEKGYPVVFIAYEQTLEEPEKVLANLLRWLEVDHTRPMVERAVSNMRFSNLQAMEKKANQTAYPIDERALFFRRGRIGSGQSDLQEATVQEIRRRTADLVTEAKKHQINLTPLSPSVSQGPSSTETPTRAFDQGTDRDSKIFPSSLRTNLQQT